MPMTENGISTTTAPGQEQYERFALPKRPGKLTTYRIQYDYRHTDGELFSCVATDLGSARIKRDDWLARKEEKASA